MKLLSKKRIFLDHASTTPVLPEVRRAMEKYWLKDFYNPSAIYEEGLHIRRDIEAFRANVARLLSAGAKDVIFTGSGTESDNLAILGTFEASRATFKKPHLIISSVEHPAVREAANEVVRRGGEVSIVPVDENGLVSPQSVLECITDETFLVSIMLANNEIGTIEPVSKIARLVRENRKKRESEYPYIHTDASQAANYIHVDVTRLNVDLLTLDGSKLYGPKGIGVLVARPNVHLRPMIFGGGQEKGLRSGTENAALIAGFSTALEIASRDREYETARLEDLRVFFIQEIKRSVPNVVINAEHVPHLPHIVSVSIPGYIAEFIAIKLDRNGILVSTGSACGTRGETGGSETIRAIGFPELGESTIRFSFGRNTTKKDLVRALYEFSRALENSQSV